MDFYSADQHFRKVLALVFPKKAVPDLPKKKTFTHLAGCPPHTVDIVANRLSADTFSV